TISLSRSIKPPPGVIISESGRYYVDRAYPVLLLYSISGFVPCLLALNLVLKSPGIDEALVSISRYALVVLCVGFGAIGFSINSPVFVNHRWIYLAGSLGWLLFAAMCS